jgi:DNA-binding YbaB/EbfC family protein
VTPKHGGSAIFHKGLPKWAKSANNAAIQTNRSAPVKQLNNLMRQAQQMQSRMQEMQAKAGDVLVDGVAGGGLVQLTLNGKNELTAIKLEKSLLDPNEVEVLKDLIVAAFNDAKAKLDKHMADGMAKVRGGMPLPPGFKCRFKLSIPRQSPHSGQP